MGVWRIVKLLNYPLHTSLANLSVAEYPYTINYVMRRRMQIDSYYELPEDKRPPRSIWDKPSELEEFFDRVYSGGEKQTSFNLPVDEVEE